ncbi:MAG: CopG family antitoxin [Pseudomonadota bacterium]|nr:antitoxin [Pseudomonadota bacterium]
MNNLTNEEKEIENNIDSLVSVSGKKRERIESILAKAKKNKAISLRIAEYDLEKLKEKAASDGIPYQTLINTVLHKYITNQLLEKNEVLKSIQVLRNKEAI